jgi:cytochrome c553
MKYFRPYIIGAVMGLLALALLPLTGLLGHQVGEREGWTGWYRWIATRQSVTLRSLTTPVPDLGDPAMAQRAAGHYQMVCAGCHGSPAEPAEKFAQDMWPRAPRLVETSARWRPPARVFQTVKYGLAHSAMPRWPVGNRDDEVWDMVAFLRLLPELSARQYLQMAGAARCVDCHGEKGQGRSGIPRLDIQSPAYIRAALVAYREGTRSSGTMITAARGLSDTEIAELAEFFGQQKVYEIPPQQKGNAANLWFWGNASRDVPACKSCHSQNARPDYPALLGQDRHYLRQQLRLFVELQEDRGGPHVQTMAKAARWLESDDIDQLAAWLASVRGP